MKTRPEFKTVGDLVDLRKAKVVSANPEYQRGAVWTLDQKKKLIDSVLRGYQLPVIYLHFIDRETAGLRQQSYEVIDGQQRIEALFQYVEGAFPLYTIDSERARFPRFLWDDPCPWGGKYFRQLPDELQVQLMQAEIPIAQIESENSNEVRDLFVRLQSGYPLNAQEKRDAYPGQFTEFILSLGGKPAIARYPGHDFFRLIRNTGSKTDRGRARQLGAQIAMLYLERRKNGSHHFVDITTKNSIDDYYYRNLDFDSDSQDCNRLWRILDELHRLLGDGKRPKLSNHEAIHLVLFVDTIWDDYTRSWTKVLPTAQGKFASALAEARDSDRSGEPNETWLKYGVLTRAGNDQGDTIRRRHRFFSQRVVEFLGDSLERKDPKRGFGPIEREIVYWKDNGICRVCDDEVLWNEAEIHHVNPHSHGGKTVLANGALVHKSCHPKSRRATEEFASEFTLRND